MKTKTALILLMITVFLSGCVIKSIHPFYTEKDLIFKKELTGIWMDNDSGTWNIEQHKTHDNIFGPSKNAPSYKITLTTEKGSSNFLAHLFQLGNQLYLDFYPTEYSCGPDMLDFHMISSHSLAKVSFSGGKIIISWYNEEWLRKLFEENRIRIAHEKSAYEMDATSDSPIQYILTASTDELQKFIIKYGNDPAAFGDKSTDYTFVLSRK